VKGSDGLPMKVGCLYDVYSDKRVTVLYPNALGGADWAPSSVNPNTGREFICSKDAPFYLKSVKVDDQVLQARGNFGQLEGGPIQGFGVKVPGHLVAMNLRTNRKVWDVTWNDQMCYSGVATTQGGLVFTGHSNHLEAYDQRNGKLLWRSPRLSGAAMAAPMTYSVNGTQYVAVYAGGNGIISFGDPTIKPDPGVSLYVFKLKA